MAISVVDLACAALAAVVIACGSGSARAADLPSDMVLPTLGPSQPPPAWTGWRGFYVGINSGYGLDHVASPYNYNRPGFSADRGFSGYTEHGPVAGGQIGYNMAFRDMPIIGHLSLLNGYSFVDHIVLGTEIDSDWSNINGSQTVTTPFGGATFGTRIKDFGMLRGRIGYSMGPLLVYVYTGLSYATTEAYYSGIGFSGTHTVTRLPLRFGTYGIGAEYRLSDRWSVRAEYLYDYIDVQYASFTSPRGTSFDFLSRASFHVGRAGLNYHFTTFDPAPVIARY